MNEPIGPAAVIGPIDRVAVLGSGSWGTAFAKVLADAGRDVMLFSRRTALADAIAADRINCEYLPDVTLPLDLGVTADLETALAGADAAVLAVPSQAMRETLATVYDLLPRRGPVISLAKGIEIGTGMRMSQIIQRVGRIAAGRVAVLSGPNLAREIAAEQPTATVLACTDPEMAAATAAACTAPYFRPYAIGDVIGAEIGGTGKNVIALAVGIVDGLGLGGNTSASFVTRGLAELSRLGVACGADAATFAGLAGLGDLVATCLSPLSRNRATGRRLGEGMSLEDAIEAGAGQVAEGVVSCRALRDLAVRHGVSMPITEAVYRVCYQHLPPTAMLTALLDSAGGVE